MADFGWSYPPGCSGTPYDDCPEPSKLVEDILVLLDRTGVPDDVSKKIVEIIENWEIEKQSSDRGKEKEKKYCFDDWELDEAMRDAEDCYVSMCLSATLECPSKTSPASS